MNDLKVVDPDPKVDEARWNAWVERGRADDLAASRILKWVVVAAILVFTALFYFARST